MTRKAIYSGSPFEKLAGYCRAVVDGDLVHISGTAGYVKGVTEADDAVGQTRQALKIIAAAMDEAGGSLADIVSLRVYVARREDILPIAEVLGQTFHEPHPTNTTVVVGFVNDEIKVEIEAMARLGSG